jgi:hypothetical protein
MTTRSYHHLLDGLCVAVLGLGPLVVNEQSNRDLDLALVTSVVEFVSESRSHYVI